MAIAMKPNHAPFRMGTRPHYQRAVHNVPGVVNAIDTPSHSFAHRQLLRAQPAVKLGYLEVERSENHSLVLSAWVG